MYLVFEFKFNNNLESFRRLVLDKQLNIERVNLGNHNIVWDKLGLFLDVMLSQF